MRHLQSRLWFRGISIFVSLCLAYSASAVGINPAILLLLRKLHSMQQAHQVQAAPPMFTDSPTEIYYGDNPDRDEAHRGGLWTDEDLYELGKQVQQNQVDWGQAGASTRGNIAAISFIGSGAGSPMPWERTFGDVDTSTGNKLSNYAIVSWPIRGGAALDFALYQSSKGNITTGAGYAWNMSYDASIQQTFNDLDALTGANVYNDDGTIIHFTYHTSTPITRRLRGFTTRSFRTLVAPGL
jgi:hypothetical protein